MFRKINFYMCVYVFIYWEINRGWECLLLNFSCTHLHTLSLLLSLFLFRSVRCQSTIFSINLSPIFFFFFSNKYFAFFLCAKRSGWFVVVAVKLYIFRISQKKKKSFASERETWRKFLWVKQKNNFLYLQ